MKPIAVLFALGTVVPSLASAAALTVNGTCALGNCASPDVLGEGGFIPLTPFSFTYTFANTDSYHVFGDFSALNSSGGSSISFNQDLTATFLGNATGTPSQTDVFTVDFLQNYAVSFTAGTFHESMNVYFYGAIALSSRATGQLGLGGQELPLMGVFAPPGMGSASVGNVFLSGLSSPVLSDFRYVYTFGAGSTAGATIGSVIPEPASLSLFGLGLIAIARASHSRKRARNS